MSARKNVQYTSCARKQLIAFISNKNKNRSRHFIPFNYIRTQLRNQKCNRIQKNNTCRTGLTPGGKLLGTQAKVAGTPALNLGIPKYILSQPISSPVGTVFSGWNFSRSTGSGGKSNCSRLHWFTTSRDALAVTSNALNVMI